MARRFKLDEGWGTALPLAGAMVASAWTMLATEWTAGLDILPWVGIGGLAGGLFLGWSVFRGRVCHMMSAVFGLAWAGYLLGGLLPGELTWHARILELVSRLVFWMVQVVVGEEARDALIFVIVLSGLFWILGYNAAWHTFRRVRAWHAILPLGLTTVVTVYYYSGPAALMRYFAVHLFFSLLYIARTHVLEREGAWQKSRVVYDAELKWSFLRAGLAIIVVALVLGWAFPAVAAVPRLAARWRYFSSPWHTVQEEWQRVFSSLGGSALGFVEPFGPSLALGAPANLQDFVVMDVEAPPAIRYYWRGAVYSHYGNNRWEALEEESLLLIPGRQPPGMAFDALRRTVTQTVTSYLPGRHMLVGASQPVAVDREAEAYIDLRSDAPLEFIRIFGILPLEVGGQYEITSLISEADQTSLRMASDDYPDWARQRYLQLPDSLPQRIRQLAEEVTADAESAYDRAVALEQYLRRNITYDLDPPEVPAGRDHVDFLLFDSRRGFCNDYATAMVVMARSVGIPSRLNVGYAQGDYDAERNAFRVRENNAHAWPEIYFPGYGWVEFEPTGSELPLLRPESSEGELNDDVPRGAGGVDLGAPGEDEGFQPFSFDESSEWQIETLADRRDLPVWSWIVGVSVAGLAAGVWWMVEKRGFRGLSGVETSYARLLRFGRLLGRPLYVSDTPFEWRCDVVSLVPRAREQIDSIVELYVRERFARSSPAAAEAKEAWKQVRPVLWWGWLKRMVSLSSQRIDAASAVVSLLTLLHVLIAAWLAAYGLNSFVLLTLYLLHRKETEPTLAVQWSELPTVTVQIPVYNERHVVERVIDAVASLHYPRSRLQVQVLDDSTDESVHLAKARAAFHRARGIDIAVLQRSEREGYKAGALEWGLAQSGGEYIAIFDADFCPSPGFLLETVPHLLARPRLGLVQTRWSYLNADYSTFTGAQTLALNGHFVVEQTARCRSGLLVGFNGSGGVWRRQCIEESGGWQADTLCEDLDLSCRAQLAGWECLYVPSVEAPAEVPPLIVAFKRQQARWAQGSVQTLRKLAGPILRSRRLRWWHKGMALMHVSSYLAHPLMVLLLLVSLPLLCLPDSIPVGFSGLGLICIGPPLVYAISERQLHTGWRRRLRFLPLVVLVGVGIAWSNTQATLRGLTRWGGVFVRTPKFRLEGRSGQWADSDYRLQIDSRVIGEIVLALYALAAAAAAFRSGRYGAIPFMLLYVLGFGTVAGIGLLQTLAPRSSRSAYPIEVLESGERG